MKRIILAGAGHAHIVALRHFARYRPNAELILVNDSPYAWYTGALPALIRGDITEDQARIDLRALAAQCGATFIAARYVDFESHTLILEGHPTLWFDTLSLSTGAASNGGVKPIPAFLARLRVWANARPPSLGIIGAGAAGVELALALRLRLGPGAKISLRTVGQLLPTAPHGARRAATYLLHVAKIPVVDELLGGLDGILHAYTPEPALTIRPSLQLTGYDHVFATGDCARLATPLPRSGAIAVRQGRVLAYNLTHAALRSFKPPPATLVILSADSGNALGWYGKIWAYGPLPMRLKARLDSRWLGKV